MVKKSLILYLTNKCNLNCKYCFVKKENTILDFEKYKNIIEACKEDICEIIFFGGEPLLCMDLIEKIINYNIKNNYDFKYKLNTNGILLNDEIVEFIKKHNIFLNVSLDGNEKSNFVNRFDLKIFQSVLNNIKKLKENNIKITINYVISPNNIKYFYESILFLEELDVNGIFLLINYDEIWEKDDIEKFKFQLYKCMDIIYSSKKQKILEVYPIHNKIIYMIEGKKAIKCNFGDDCIVVSTSGKRYPCVSFVENKEYEITDENKNIKNIVPLDKCKKCKYEDYCINNCMCRYVYSNKENELDVNCEFEKIFIDFSKEIVKELLGF